VDKKKIFRWLQSNPGRPARRYTESLFAMEAPKFSLQMLKFLLTRKISGVLFRTVQETWYLA
jgi:hypothetical protein